MDTDQLSYQPAWHSQAACRDVENPEIFFPKKVHDEDAQAARAICRKCPVARECFTDAIETGDRFGIRGGYSHTQRSAVLRRAARAKSGGAS